MPNLRRGVETAWWALAIQGENFWCFPLMTWLIFFQRPFTFGCGEGCLPEPPRALTSTYGRCEAENWWRQKPKKSIGPVSQWGGERLLKTQSRHVLAAWCRSSAHLRKHWISRGLGFFAWFWMFGWLGCFFFNFCVNTPFTYLFLNLLRRMEAKRVMLGGNLHDINKKKNPWKLSGKSMK